MNQCVDPSLEKGWRPGIQQQYQIYKPQSCGSEALKVASLKGRVQMLEEQLQEAEKVADQMEFYAKGELISAFIMETSIGFLDLAASAFGVINPAASKAAKAGIVSIKAVQLGGEVYNGTATPMKATETLGDAVFKIADPKTIVGKAAMSQAKTAYDGAMLAIKSATGTSQADLQSGAKAFVIGEATGNMDLMGDALAESGQKMAGGTLKGLAAVGDMYVAAENYGKALDQRFETYLSQQQSTQDWIIGQRQTLSNLIKRTKLLLDDAVKELEDCLAGV